MQDTVVYLIRHGDVDNPSGLHYGRTRDIGLTKKGAQQLHDLGKVLESRQEKPIALYTSPLRRTQESASNLFPDVSVRKLDDLLETETHGFEGMTIDEERTLTDNQKALPIGLSIEDPAHLAKRMIQAITKARTEHPGAVVALISHADPIAYAVWRLVYGDSPFPAHKEVVKAFFPEKGTSWRLVFDDEGKLLSHQLVTG